VVVNDYEIMKVLKWIHLPPHRWLRKFKNPEGYVC
jgi:hypothetical protein